jgi:uncharacterized protein (DUF952 family)
VIFHVATEREWVEGQRDGRYRPARLAADGFVHCSATLEIAQAVIAAYFSEVRAPLVILHLDEAKLDVELKWEAPAPLTPGPHAHHATALFPHVYGSIPLAAVVGLTRRPADE